MAEIKIYGKLVNTTTDGIIADYDQLDGLPIIKADFTASDFNPTKNTYYLFTGTTGTYTNGKLYFYNGSSYEEIGAGATIDTSNLAKLNNSNIFSSQQFFESMATFDGVVYFNNTVDFSAGSIKGVNLGEEYVKVNRMNEGIIQIMSYPTDACFAVYPSYGDGFTKYAIGKIINGSYTLTFPDTTDTLATLSDIEDAVPIGVFENLLTFSSSYTDSVGNYIPYLSGDNAATVYKRLMSSYAGGTEFGKLFFFHNTHTISGDYLNIILPIIDLYYDGGSEVLKFCICYKGNIYQFSYSYFNADIDDQHPTKIGSINLTNGTGSGSIQQILIPQSDDDENDYDNTTTGRNSATFGYSNTTDGKRSLTTGKLNTNNGANSIVAGLRNTNTSNHSLIIGDTNTNNGISNIIGGVNNTTSTNSRHSLVVGSNNTNNYIRNIIGGADNIVEGHDNIVGGIYANVLQDDSDEGNYGCNLVCVSGNSNFKTYVKGYGSWAGGQGHQITNKCVFAHGTANKSSRDNQTILGAYNNPNSDALFIIGNGTSNANRLNVFEVLDDGRAKVKTRPLEDDDVVRLGDLSAGDGKRYYKHRLTFYTDTDNAYSRITYIYMNIISSKAVEYTLETLTYELLLQESAFQWVIGLGRYAGVVSYYKYTSDSCEMAIMSTNATYASPLYIITDVEDIVTEL